MTSILVLLRIEDIPPFSTGSLRIGECLTCHRIMANIEVFSSVSLREALKAVNGADPERSVQWSAVEIIALQWQMSSMTCLGKRVFAGRLSRSVTALPNVNDRL